jgi:serine/threonine-protein kinase
MTIVEETRSVTVVEERKGRSWLLYAAIGIVTVIAAALIWQRMRPAPPASIHSLAVLPFESLNNNADDAYLKFGMADALINRLSAVEGLAVRPISAVRAIPGGARDVAALSTLLQVDAILEGNVQRDGDRLRVTSRLIRAGDGIAIWSGSFDQPLMSLFALQDELAERVARTLAPALRGRPLPALRMRYTSDPEAYELYLRGRAQWSTFTPAGRTESIAFYRAALDKDPRFVLAWVGISNAYTLIGIYGPLQPTAAFALAREAADKAYALDPNSPEVFAAMAVIDVLHTRNWERALHNIQRAQAMKPDLIDAAAMHGYYLQAAGRPDEALAQFRLECTIDPVWHVPQNDLLHGLVLARRWDETLREVDLVLRKDPQRAFAHNMRGIAQAQLGRSDEALQSFQTATKLGASWARAEEGWLRGRRGDRTGALRLAEELRATQRDSNTVPFYLAMIHAGIGDRDEAMHQLEIADAMRYSFLFRIRVMPEFDSIRSDPRFVSLERRLNLPNR